MPESDSPNILPVVKTDSLPARDISPEQRRLDREIGRRLLSPEAQIHYYDPPTARRAETLFTPGEGNIKFIVIDCADKRTHILVTATEEILPNKKNLQAIEARWIDKKAEKIGYVSYSERDGESPEYIDWETDPLDQRHLDIWIKQGGLNILPDAFPGRRLRKEEIENVAILLEEGQPSQTLMQNAKDYLTKAYGDTEASRERQAIEAKPKE